MSDLNMPGGADPATDGDIQSSGERLADQVGKTPPEGDQADAIPTPAPPD